MNYKLIFKTMGKVLTIFSFLFFIPLITSIIYKEECFYSFLICFGISFTVGLLLMLLIKPSSQTYYAKESIIIATLAWIIMSMVGALPYTISGSISSYIDSLFESVSGFTTTGSSIILDVEILPKSIIIWRSLTHFIGGMGILVFVVALSKNMSNRPLNVLKAEMPGPSVDKFKPKSGDNARILYLIYIALTVVESIFLAFGDMNIFESIVYSLSTAGTGGFASKNTGLMGYSSYSQIVITIFMFLFSLNFNIYYLLIIRKFKAALLNSELWFFVILVISSITILAINTFSIFGNLFDTIKISSFLTCSIMSTTGFTIVDFNNYPALSKSLLLVIMFIGGCSGSTAGGLKVSRIIILFKAIQRDIRKAIHPNQVQIIKIDGKKLDDDTVNRTTTYLSIYFLLFLALFLILALFNATSDGGNTLTYFTSIITCFNNVGPGFDLVGPVNNFAFYNVGSKITLIVTMLLGRLEIYPLLIALIPSTYISK